MDALAGRDPSQTAPQMLTAPGERRIVGGGEVEAHHPEQGVREPFGLTQREMVDEPQGQGGLDGEIRVPPLPAPPAAPAGRPGTRHTRLTPVPMLFLTLPQRWGGPHPPGATAVKTRARRLGPRPSVANDRLRYMQIGSARVSKGGWRLPGAGSAARTETDAWIQRENWEFETHRQAHRPRHRRRLRGHASHGSAAAPRRTLPRRRRLARPAVPGAVGQVRPRAGSRSPVSPRGSPARLPRVGGREMVSGGGLRRVDDVGGPHLVRVVGPRVVRAGNGGSHRGKALGRPRTQLSRRFGHQVGATCVYVSDLVHAGRFRAEGA